ncbi:unnamed protein product [Lathyrus oleraceus]
MGRLLDHGMIKRDEALKMMVDYMGVDLGETLQELEATRWAHTRFRYPERLYTQQLKDAYQATGDGEKVAQHKSYALRVYQLYLDDTSIFMDKSATYVDVIYM